MRQLDGYDLVGVGLFVFGICLAAMGTALIMNGEVAVGVMAIVGPSSTTRSVAASCGRTGARDARHALIHVYLP